jgi:hypothetical protein
MSSVSTASAETSAQQEGALMRDCSKSHRAVCEQTFGGKSF